MIVYPNAKINIYLDIVGKRVDGYHELETLMIPVDIFDEMQIEFSDEDDVLCEGINKEENLVYKALKLFKEEYCVDKNFKISLKKNIPSKAGLGGGSSDAAFTIKALCDMCNIDIQKEEEKIIQIAAKIGSDVPFFIYNKPAIARGKGEKIEVVEFEKINGVIIFDGLGFSTKEVFSNVVVCGEKNKKLVRNDLEKAISIYKESNRVFEIKKELIEKGCFESGMSGSGSSVFGLCRTEEESKKVADELKQTYLYVTAFKSLN